MAIAAFLVLVVALIVIGVKLHHRNLELDDLYDEYGIDLDEEEAVPAKGKKAKAVAAKGEPAVREPVQKAKVEDEDDFDDFEEFDDDDLTIWRRSGFEEEYDEVDYEEDYGYDNDGDESEELIDDLDELLSSQPSKKRGHMEEDDTFKVDLLIWIKCYYKSQNRTEIAPFYFSFISRLLFTLPSIFATIQNDNAKIW